MIFNLLKHLIPSGTILIWYGDLEKIPDGFIYCDGSNNTPDLRGRFVIGTSSEYSFKEQGGEKQHQLTTNELPAHNHSPIINRSDVGSLCTKGHSLEIPAANQSTPILGYLPNTVSNHSGTGTTGGNLPHNNLPPYIALHYIMKI